MKTNKEISKKNTATDPNLIDLNSPDLKEKVARMDNIIRNLKQPLPFLRK